MAVIITFMENIILILNRLKAGLKVTDEVPFLKRYDENKNSIFDDGEIEKLKDDLLEFAKKDDNWDNLDEKEIAAFYNAIAEGKKNAKEDSAVVELIAGWIKNAAGLVSDVEEELNLYPDYENLSEVKKEYMNVIASNLKKFDKFDDCENFIGMLTSDKFSDEKITANLKVLEEVVKIPSFSISFSNIDFITGIDSLPEGRIDRITNNYQYLTSENMALLLSFDDKRFERAEKLLKYTQNSSLYEYRPVIDLKKDEYFTAALGLVSDGCPFRSFELAELAQIPLEKLDMVRGYANTDRFSANGLVVLSELSEVEFRRAEQELFTLKDRDEQLNASQIAEIVKLEPWKYQNAKKILKKDLTLSDGTTRKFNGDEAAAYAGLSSHELKRALEFYNIKNRSYGTDLNPEDIAALAVMETPELDKFIEKYPNFHFLKNDYLTNSVTLMAPDILGDREFVFDRNKGIVETAENISEDEELKRKIVRNTEKNIYQEVVFGKLEHYSGQVVTEETIKYYDREGNLQRTIKMKKGDYPGVPNISMTDQSGTRIPLQYSSVDKRTGIKTISKDFVSPEGVRTEYFYESSPDGLEILNYKITDKDGKVLMNREQTFQKVDENNFVSSLNGKVYNINFEGEKITIKENNSNQTNVIDLAGKIPEDGHDVILNILKHVPGNQLLIMKKLPIEKIEYDTDVYANNNALWSGDDKSIILTPHPQSENFEVALFSTFMHEYGHYIDSDPVSGECKTISDNQDLQKIYDKELKAFLKNTTSLQQDYVKYFIFNNGFYNPEEERVAEANMLLQTNPCDYLSVRALYYQQYFPRTIAKISELVQEIENK